MEAQPQILPGTGTLPERGFGVDVRRPNMRIIAGFCLFVVAFYFAYRHAMSFSQVCASPFWFPDSVLLAALLATPSRRWWIYIAGALPIRLFSEVSHGIPTWFLLTTFAIDGAKGVFTTVLLRLYIKNPFRLETAREYGLYCLFAALLIPAFAALAGATARHYLGHDFWTAWEQWFLGNALTHLVVTPVIFYWAFGMPWKAHLPPMNRRIEAVLLALGLIGTSYMAFDVGAGWSGFEEARFFAPVPFLFWAAVRFGMFGACGAMGILATFSIDAALDGHGPFSGQTPGDVATTLQSFLLLRAAPLGLVAVLIEQRKGVERSLRESEDRVKIAAQTLGLEFWIWDPMTGQVWASEKLGDLLGMAPGEVVTYPSFMSHVVPEDQALVASAVNQSVTLRGDLDIECRVRLPDGTVRWISSRGRGHQDDDGGPWRLVGTCMDITAPRQAAAEVELQRVELAHLSRVAALSALSGSLAHELNQPLGSILSNAQAAQHLISQATPDLAELRAILGDIIDEDRRAREVIKRLRTMLQRGEVAVQPVNVNENLGELLRLTRSDLNARDVAVTCHLANDLPLAMTDRVQLQQVILNLVMNACDAMETIPPEQRRLTLTTFVAQNEVRIGVLDCGVGLPEDVEVLFQPFHTTKSGGLGLGLSICRMLVSAHGGRLWVERKAECGAAFYVALPPSKEKA